MTFPTNELEQVLEAASDGRTGVDSFVELLFRSEVILLDLAGADGNRLLGTITTEGKELLPVVTSAEQAQLSGLTMPVGTRIRLVEPTVEPVELLAAIAHATDEIPAVRSLSRCWAQSGDEPPNLVLGVDLDPDNPDVRAERDAGMNL